MVKFATPYNGAIKKVTLECNDISLTDQSSKDECDIGFIIENFVRTGQLPERPNMNYVDCTSVQSYEDSMQLVAECKTQFELLPAEERDKFKTVSGWLEYVNNPSNLQDCIEKGYIDGSTVPVTETSAETVKEVSNPPAEQTVEKTVQVSEKSSVNANS